jgi:hypothetical protein
MRGAVTRSCSHDRDAARSGDVLRAEMRQVSGSIPRAGSDIRLPSVIDFRVAKWSHGDHFSTQVAILPAAPGGYFPDSRSTTGANSSMNALFTLE